MFVLDQGICIGCFHLQWHQNEALVHNFQKGSFRPFTISANKLLDRVLKGVTRELSNLLCTHVFCLQNC
jgi:hypothetical protein